MIRWRRSISSVLADTEDTWGEIFSQAGRRYEDPVLVLFERAVQSACGTAQPGGRSVLLPERSQGLSRSVVLPRAGQRFGAPGDFAQAYVVAHEVGHHVQTLLGLSNRVSQMRSRMSGEQANGLSVRQELQADCYAGVWGHHAARRDFLEPGDAEEGLRAAAAIGDDRLQKQGQGYVSPESFTHGSSAQRQEWLMRGLKTGDINQCDTFGGSN